MASRFTLAAAAATTALLLASSASAQQMGAYTPEVHPTLRSEKCTVKGGCKSVNTSVVLDSSYRWTHNVGGYEACVPNGFNSTLCPDAATCAKNCALEGADYASYGVATKGDALTLNLYTTSADNVTSKASPRVYLLNEDGKTYDMFSLLNGELAFDVDVSKVPCEVNGALYLSEMSSTGGESALNPAGAAYGTGYCDAQCPVPTFINGVANINMTHGACCNEMDIWEANSQATAFTPHPCNVTGLYACEGALCGAADRYSGVCDEDGCGFNSYHNGARSFYGKGNNMTVDTNKPFTVVTQFLTTDNTTTGDLREIRRIYVQNGHVIQNSKVNLPGQAAVNSEDDTYCSAAKFHEQGAMKGMGDAIARGMVLIFSIWDDASGGMLWLDGNTGTTAASANGPCPATFLDEAGLQAAHSDARVTFSKIRSGELGSTYQRRMRGGSR